MAATNPTKPGDDEDPQARQERPMPDEDGPHDVPDDKVIEKTLPSGREADTMRDGRP
jgi:hypothetical protein